MLFNPEPGQLAETIEEIRLFDETEPPAGVASGLGTPSESKLWMRSTTISGGWRRLGCDQPTGPEMVESISRRMKCPSSM